MKQLIAEAKEKLSTFKDTIIKEDEERERHLISSLVVRPEDMESSKDTCQKTPSAYGLMYLKIQAQFITFKVRLNQ